MNKKLFIITIPVLIFFLTLATTVQAADPSLVGWWKLDDGSGITATDSSGNGNNGTISGSPNWLAGKLGGALQFNGTDCYINAGNGTSLNQFTNEISITFWLKTPGFTTTFATVISKGDGAWRMGRNAGGNVLHMGYTGTNYFDGSKTVTDNEWHHCAGIYNGTTATIYVDGVADTTNTATVQIPNGGTYNVLIGQNEQQTGRYLTGTLDDVRLYKKALTVEELQLVMTDVGKNGLAENPSPKNKESDVARDVTLSWKPGAYVTEQGGTHNVFFSTDINDVNDATLSNPLGATVSSGQLADANTFTPYTLEFGKTYYWRVDEVNAPSKPGQYKGNIWSFTVEKAALDLPFANIANVTAISSAKDNDPNNTVNGSGLGIDPNFPNRHEISSGLNSWVSSGKDTNNVWIQYDFDKLYRIHEMLVWNYNHTLSFRYGFKDVLVQYSIDGQAWVDVPDANYFNKAANNSNYEYNTTVDFNDVVAKSVRITAFSNHGTSSVKSYGLAEVRFTYVPVYARIPTPADNAQNVAFGTMLKWRKGREALTHKLYIGTDEAAVTNGAVTPATLTASSYLPNLSMGNTYYWRVDEINNGMDPSLWKGDVWSFSVPSTILIEGFESGYGNDPGSNAVFLTWKDGAELGDGANGSYMGRKDTPYLHTINHSGGHSAPMQYDNESYSYSEVTAETSELLNGSDWSKGSPKTLTIWFRGDPNVTDVGDAQLYCEIGGKKAVYTGSINALTQDIWRQWDINLTTLGVNLSNITTITIGVEKIGSKGSIGVIYLDDIMLTGTTALVAYPDVFVEAEAYSTITSPMEVNNVYPGASGDQYIKVKNGTTSSSTAPPTDGHVTYQVNLTGGKYVIWGRVSIPVANQDAFWVKVDGATSDIGLDASGWCMWNAIPAGVAWHWDDVHSTQSDNSTPKVTWTIPAGVTTITIAYRDSDAANPPRLDSLLFQKVGL